MIVDQLSILGVEPSVSENQIIHFRAHRHFFRPSILNKEKVAINHEVINKAATYFNLEKRNLAEQDNCEKAFPQIMNLWKRNFAVRRYTLAKRFGKIAADLLGVDMVSLFTTKRCTKNRKAIPHPWHQDQYYLPLDTMNTVIKWMTLVDISDDIGMTTFASFSNKDGVLGNIPISDKSDKSIKHDINEKDYPIHRESQRRAGNTTWHYGCTMSNA